jgi:DUF4097 and DUF4098 domain-containing protein YvlB
MPAFDTPEPIIAIIDIASGHVRILASDRSDTIVEVRPTIESETVDVEAAKGTQIEYANGRLLVKAPKHRRRSLFGRSASIDLTIELPSGSRVDAKAWADFRGEGRLGESSFDTSVGSIRLDQTGRLKLHSGVGDISVGRSSVHVEATTSTGKIWLGEIDGSAVLRSSTGDVTVGAATGDLRLNTANGDITVDRAMASVAAKTSSGSVRIGEVVRGSVMLETGYGEVEVAVRKGTAAWLDLDSKYGSVRSLLTSVHRPEQSDEIVEVHARSGYGDIVIRHS